MQNPTDSFIFTVNLKSFVKKLLKRYNNMYRKSDDEKRVVKLRFLESWRLVEVSKRTL